MSNHALIKLQLEQVKKIASIKLKAYASLLSEMNKHDGWLPLPDYVLSYFKQIDVINWADLYFSEGQEKWIYDHQTQILDAKQVISDQVGADPTIEEALNFLNSIINAIDEVATGKGDLDIPELKFLDGEIKDINVSELTELELKQQRDTWISYQVGFYNDLSLATHGESIITLVSKAINNLDDQAMVKAIQIDRSLLNYFQDRINKQTLNGNSDFFDQLSYRLKNPPSRGEIKHPLLWILFGFLKSLGVLSRSLTSSEILQIYSDAVEAYPQFYIDDVQVVQRQRKTFNQM